MGKEQFSADEALQRQIQELLRNPPDEDITERSLYTLSSKAAAYFRKYVQHKPYTYIYLCNLTVKREKRGNFFMITAFCLSQETNQAVYLERKFNISGKPVGRKIKKSFRGRAS